MTKKNQYHATTIKIPRAFIKSPAFYEITRCLGLSELEAMGKLMFYFAWESGKERGRKSVRLIDGRFGQGFCIALQAGRIGVIKGDFFYLKEQKNLIIRGGRSAGGLTRISAPRNEKGQFLPSNYAKRMTTYLIDSEGNYLGTLGRMYAKNRNRRQSL